MEKEKKSEIPENKLAKILENNDTNYIPSIFKNQAKDLILKAENLGLNVESLNHLNRDRYMRNLEILSQDGLKLAIMPEQTKEMVLTAIYQNPAAIKFVIEQDEEICNLVCSFKPELIYNIRFQSEDQIQFVLDRDPMNIQWIRNQRRNSLLSSTTAETSSMCTTVSRLL